MATARQRLQKSTLEAAQNQAAPTMRDVSSLFSAPPADRNATLTDALAAIAGSAQAGGSEDTGGNPVNTSRNIRLSGSSSSSSRRGGGGGGGGGAVEQTNGKAVAGKYKVQGGPHQGTHTLGNWQSDNAYDISGKKGQKILAVGDGKVVKVNRAHEGDEGRFGGIAVTIQTKGGGKFYGHLSKAHVKPGQKIRRGQVIGRMGVANGLAHLHFGVEKGNPRRFV